MVKSIDQFLEEVEGHLRRQGASDNLNRDELAVAEDFRRLDFGAEPCATQIMMQRQAAATGRSDGRVPYEDTGNVTPIRPDRMHYERQPLEDRIRSVEQLAESFGYTAVAADVGRNVLEIVEDYTAELDDAHLARLRTLLERCGIQPLPALGGKP